MIIELELTNYGGIIVSARNKKIHAKIRKHIREMNGKQEDGTAFFQSLGQAVEALSLKPREVRELERGWGIAVRMDTWEALHIWGYDAHTLAEAGEV